MCLVRSFLELGHFDPADVGKRLVAWFDAEPRDVGGTTARTLSRLRAGTPVVLSRQNCVGFCILGDGLCKNPKQKRPTVLAVSRCC